MPIVQQKINLSWKEILYLIRGYIACSEYLVAVSRVEKEELKKKKTRVKLRNTNLANSKIL